MSKSYNPFKMWGSYVGGIIGLFLAYLSKTLFLPDLVDLKLKWEYGFCAEVQQCIDMVNSTIDLQFLFFMQYLIYAFVGFLIGWGIHSLARALR